MSLANDIKNINTNLEIVCLGLLSVNYILKCAKVLDKN